MYEKGIAPGAARLSDALNGVGVRVKIGACCGFNA